MLIFGGGVAALMVGFIVLEHQTGSLQAGAREDLKTAVTTLRQTLTRWDYEKLGRYTSGISRPAFQRMFDDAKGGDPAGLHRFRALLSAMDTFPSIRFTDVKPESVDVSYEVEERGCSTRPVVSFVRREDGRTGSNLFFMPTARFPTATGGGGGQESSDDSPVTFREGKALPLSTIVEKLFDALASGSLDDFRSLMVPGKMDVEQADDIEERLLRGRLDAIRQQVMACGASRLRKMIPNVGALPNGTRWFHLSVVADVDEKKLMLDINVVTQQAPSLPQAPPLPQVPSSSEPYRIRWFQANVVKEGVGKKGADPLTP
jgi:hypothetical protein